MSKQYQDLNTGEFHWTDEYVKELEDQLEEIAELANKPMTQGGWSLDVFIKATNAILYREKS